MGLLFVVFPGPFADRASALLLAPRTGTEALPLALRTATEALPLVARVRRGIR